MTGTYKYDMTYWDLPKFHCEMVKPICDEALRNSLEVRFDLILIFPTRGGALSQTEDTAMCWPKGCLFWIFKIPLMVVKITKSNSNPHYNIMILNCLKKQRNTSYTRSYKLEPLKIEYFWIFPNPIIPPSLIRLILRRLVFVNDLYYFCKRRK